MNWSQLVNTPLSTNAPVLVDTSTDPPALWERDLVQSHMTDLTAKLKQNSVSKGHSVAVGLGLCPSLVISCITLFQLGAVYVPITNQRTINELITIAVERECRWLITDMSAPQPCFSLSHGLFLFALSVHTYSDTRSEQGSTCINYMDDDIGDIAYMVYTSGSTNPTHLTQVRVPTKSIFTHLLEFESIWPTAHPNTIALTTRQTFDPHLIEILHAWFHGLPLVIAHTLSTVTNYASVLSTTPSRLLSELDPETLSKILIGSTRVQYLYLGGEQFPFQRLHRLVPMHEWKIVVANLYGTTELSVWATCHHLHLSLLPFYLTHGVPIGSSLPATNLLVSNASTAVIGTKLRSTVVNGKIQWYDRTNDCLKKIGEHYVLCGRTDRQVKRHGCRIQLETLESQLTHCKCVQQALAIQSPSTNKLIIGIYGLKQPESLNSVWEYIYAHFSSAHIPDQLVVMTDIPKTTNGKFDTHRATQTILAQSELLDIAKSNHLHSSPSAISALAHVSSKYFVQLGGDSVHAIRIIERIVRYVSPDRADSARPTLFNTLLHHPIGVFLELCSDLECDRALVLNQLSPILKPLPNSLCTQNPIQPSLSKIIDLGKCIDAVPLVIHSPTTNNTMTLVGSHAGNWCVWHKHANHVDSWTLPKKDRIEAQLAIHPLNQSLVLIPTLSGSLISASWKTGHVHFSWDLSRPDPIKCTPVFDEQLIWIGTYKHHVHCGRLLEIGSIEWLCKWDVDGAVNSIVIIHDQPDRHIVATTNKGTLYSFDPSSTPATLRWSVPINDPVFSPPIYLPTKHMFIATVQSIVFIDLNGTVHKSKQIPHPVFSPPVWIPSHNRIVFGTHGGNVCLCDTDANVHTVFRLDAPIYARVLVVLSNNMFNHVVPPKPNIQLVVAATSGQLVHLSLGRDSVRTLNQVHLPGPVFSSPVCIPHSTVNSTDSVVVGCRDNYLYQISFHH